MRTKCGIIIYVHYCLIYLNTTNDIVIQNKYIFIVQFNLLPKINKNIVFHPNILQSISNKNNYIMMLMIYNSIQLDIQCFPFPIQFHVQLKVSQNEKFQDFTFHTTVYFK